MRASFSSPWANRTAKALITVLAVVLFCAIRPDIYASTRDEIVATIHGRIITPQIIEHYFATTDRARVQIGAGPNNQPGWLNTDIEPGPQQAYLDATKPLPFDEGSIDYIFSEHVVEHLFYSDGLKFFKEAHRVLRPGGKIRTVTPNLMKLVALLDPETVEKQGHYIARKLAWEDWERTVDPGAIIVNNEMHWFGHRCIYTPKLLRAALEEAGFTDIRQYVAGETSDPTFTEVEQRPRQEHRDVNAYEAMAFEATR